MWFSIVLLVAFLAIVFYQLMQGFVSAFIMMVLTICCVAVSLGTYEYVAINLLAPRFNSNYAVAVSIGLTFGVPLVVLRCIFDVVIKRAPLLPGLIDKIGALSCGVVIALLMVGMFALAMPNLPFNGGAVLDFTRFDKADYASTEDSKDLDPADLSKPERNVLLSPDRTACSVGAWLSDGVFSAEHSFAEHNPDLVQAMAWRNAVPAEAPRYAQPDAIEILAVERIPEVFNHKPARGRGTESFDAIQPASGKEFVMLRVKLKSSATDGPGEPMFTLRQFRLVGRRDEFSPLMQQYPIALEENYTGERPPAGVPRHIKAEVNFGKPFPLVDRLYFPRKKSKRTIEIVFELPKKFVPWFLEFRYGARCPVTFQKPGEPGTEAGGDGTVENRSSRRSRRSSTPANAGGGTSSTTTADASDDGAFVPNSGRGGRVRGASTISGASKFSDQLPEALSNYKDEPNTEIRWNGSLTDGHLVAYLDDQASGGKKKVVKFDVPSDKRLLQLSVGTLQAKSTYGKALSFATRVIQNFLVSDANGRQYQICGKVAIADVGGRQVMEVQYFSTQIGSIGGLGAYNVIQEQHLAQPGAQQFFLFLVEPGARITTFSTGGSKSRQDDLTSENLVAPD